MIEIIYIGNKLIIDSINYFFKIIYVEDDNITLELNGDVNYVLFRINANETTINGVLQTSDQMIIDTLNGQS